jgi:predicted AlkP superfamily phosphohydrolase/phosphomutase/tetratricopeptide (TPR) repeat protein
LIGWDAADWKVATPLIDQGLMPALNGLINHGVMGNLATLRPILSPMLWNSIATRKRADKHGIHGFVEPDPQTGGVRPAASTSRKVKAIWNILSQKGYKTHVLGWFASHPAEPINGVAVSDLYPVATAPHDKPWPLSPGTVHPERLRDCLAELRMHPAEVTPEAILPFIPLAAKIDQKNDRRLASFAQMLAETCTIHNAATWVLQNEPWHFLAVYYNGIDHFSHGFMPYYPPRMEGLPEEQYEIYKGVVDGAYRFHDMMLQTLLQLAGPDVTVILCSDHGFHCGSLRPRSIPKEPAGPAVQHRPFGILCMKGPGIRQDERIYGATLLDIAPTILSLFGLPVGEDMDGRVLAQAFQDAVEIQRLPSWESEPGECGMHPAELRVDPESAKALLEQFAALGYISAPDEDKKKAVDTAIREDKYNLARVYLDKRQPQAALPMLEGLYRDEPQAVRFAQCLAECYFALRRIDDAERVLTESLNRPPEPADSNSVAAAEPESVPAEAESAPSSSPPRPWANWLMGVIRFEQGRMEEALVSLLDAQQSGLQMPELQLRLGQTYLRLNRLDEAQQSFNRALGLDDDSAEAHLGLAMVHLRKRRNEEATEEALAAVSLQHFLPLGHFCLGIALVRLGLFHRARAAFETCLTIAPGFINAHRWLAVLNALPDGDQAKAHEHRRLARELIQRRRESATP